MNIAPYYLDSPIFLAITQNENFKSITIEELFKSKHTEYLRDDSEIIDDGDFIFVLSCLTYWGVEKLPKIIYDYIDKNLFNINIENYNDMISSELIENIHIYIKIKFTKPKSIVCSMNYSVAIKEDRTLISWG
jgi:hypothetical protein